MRKSLTIIAVTLFLFSCHSETPEEKAERETNEIRQTFVGHWLEKNETCSIFLWNNGKAAEVLGFGGQYLNAGTWSVEHGEAVFNWEVSHHTAAAKLNNGSLLYYSDDMGNPQEPMSFEKVKQKLSE